MAKAMAKKPMTVWFVAPRPQTNAVRTMKPGSRVRCQPQAEVSARTTNTASSA